MWDVRACRACLTTLGKLDRIGEASKRMYTTMTGIEIKDGDGYPPYFCMECRNMIKKSLLFIRKCRRAYVSMKGLMSTKKQVTYVDIAKVNRKQMNLESKIGCWYSNKSAFFALNTDYELEQFTPIKKSYVSAIDIAPEEIVVVKTNDLQIQDEIKSDPVEETETTKDASEGDDLKQDVDIPIQEEAAENVDIDMDDVFKDLDDAFDTIDDDDGLESVFEFKQPPRRNKKVKEINPRIVDMQLQQIWSKNSSSKAQMLMFANIRALSEDEQEEAFTFRKSMPRFQAAPYKCGLCLTIYIDLATFIAHANLHNQAGNAQHCCNVCKCKFYEEKNLLKHTAETHSYEYTCKLCETRYFSLSDYLTHSSVAHKHTTQGMSLDNYFNDEHIRIEPLPPSQMIRRPLPTDMVNHYQCDKCPASYVNMGRFLGHSKKHIEPKQFPDRCLCDICKKWFRTKKKMIKHMTINHLFSYTCTKCNKVSYSRAGSFQHAFSCPGVVADKPVCDLCGRMCKSDKGLRKHRVKIHYNEFCKEHCVTCGIAFEQKVNLYSHQLAQHGFISLNDPSKGAPDAYCKHCDVHFLGRTPYEVHCLNMKHEEMNEFVNTCLHCKNKFDTPERLERHKFHCTPKKLVKYPVKCEYCETVLQSSQTFRKHMLRKHASLRGHDSTNYVLCEICGLSCHVAVILRHRKAHEKSNNYETTLRCGICHLNFYERKKDYILHVVSQHTVKPYVCTICELRFDKRAECRDHILKIHAPARPYHCEICQREFSHIDYLNDHSVKIHNVNVKKNHKSSVSMKGKFVTYAHMKIDVSLVEKHVVDTIVMRMSDYLNKQSFPIDNKYDYLITLSTAVEKDQQVGVSKKIKAGKRKIDDISQAIQENTYYEDDENVFTVETKPLTDDKEHNTTDTIKQQNVEVIHKKIKTAQKKHTPHTSSHKKQKKDTTRKSKAIKNENRNTDLYSKPERGADMPNLLLNDGIKEDFIVEGSETVSETQNRYELGIRESENIYGLGTDERYVVDGTYGLESSESQHSVLVEDNVTDERLVIDGDTPLDVVEQDGEKYVMINDVLYRIENE